MTNTNNNEIEDMETCNTLTRYLYSRVEVKQNIFISLLLRDVEQALFWGYEYYYSGFEEETFEYLKNIYDEIYAENNPSLKEFIINLTNEWNKNDDNKYDCHVGSIIYTLALRPYNMISFVKNKLNYKISKDEVSDNLMPECFIILNSEHIEKYKTKIISLENNEKAYYLLKQVKLYPSYKEYNNLFDNKHSKTFLKTYHSELKNWLYYASKSPIWYERISEFNGIIDDNTKEVYFENENDESHFCELWDYEPDELPTNIQELSVGSNNIKQLTIRQFCKKIKYVVISKIIRTVKKTK